MTPYPASLQEIAIWAAGQKVKLEEARLRFAQYGVLRAITDSQALSSALVLKGGNALDFIWCPNRSTRDLDFSSRRPDIDKQQIEALLEPSLQAAGRVTGLAFRLQRVTRQPPGPEKTFITFEVTVGYAFPQDRRSREKIAQKLPVSTIVPLDISLNEPICSVAEVDLQGTHLLQVSRLEDIVAEKLRALLQQVHRNRHRRQDLLDVAVLLQSGTAINRAQVTEFLQVKAESRCVPVSREAFRSRDLRDRAQLDYASLAGTTRQRFVSFEEAYALVMSFVDQLAIPER